MKILEVLEEEDYVKLRVLLQSSEVDAVEKVLGREIRDFEELDLEKLMLSLPVVVAKPYRVGIVSRPSKEVVLLLPKILVDMCVEKRRSTRELCVLKQVQLLEHVLRVIEALTYS